MMRAVSRGIRQLHTLPRLHIDAQKGVPDLYSPAGFKVAWSDYQKFILGKLNSAIVDTENETRVPFHIMMATKTKPDLAHVFNYASQAHNNHLFFSALRNGEKDTDNAPTGLLLRRITEKFGSVDGLKRAIDRAASQIYSNGWVFLVESPNKELAVVGANVAGSAVTFSRGQQLDLNGLASEDTQAELQRIESAVANREKNWNIELLALNLWEHAYVPDFGVAGRKQYIDAWWAAIDWRRVDDRLFRGRI